MAELTDQCCTTDAPGELLRARRQGACCGEHTARAAAAPPDARRRQRRDGRAGPRDRPREVRRRGRWRRRSAHADCCSPADETGVFGAALYAERERARRTGRA